MGAGKEGGREREERMEGKDKGRDQRSKGGGKKGRRKLKEVRLPADSHTALRV